MTESVICECGWEVKGNSIDHAKSNLKQHKKSKIHKKLIGSENARRETN